MHQGQTYTLFDKGPGRSAISHLDNRFQRQGSVRERAIDDPARFRVGRRYNEAVWSYVCEPEGAPTCQRMSCGTKQGELSFNDRFLLQTAQKIWKNPECRIEVSAL